MADVDSQLPPWLQRNLAYREPFDPSPWLQERYRRQVEAQKLPLQLQELELRNREATLAIESRGLANDVLAQEQSDYAADLPLIKESLALAEKTPGGALTLPVPAFRSKRAQAAWLMRQKTDAATSYGMSVERRIIEQTKRAADAMAVPGVPTIRPGPDGLFDETELAAAEQAATKYRAAQRLSEIQARNDWRYDEQGNLIGGRDAKQEPFVIHKDGLVILFNPNTGRGDILDKPVSRDRWVRDNLPRWMKQFGIVETEAINRLNKTYDQLFPAPGGAVTAPAVGPQRFRMDPATGRIVPAN